jgi:hypothetical protein
MQPWIQALNNHLWWSAATCRGDADLLREKWISILHHIRNVHSWAGGTKFLQCAHPPLSQNEQRLWLDPKSAAYEKLKSIVLSKKLLKDIAHLTSFCHTGNLEVFHSVMLKYCPKRQHFSYNGMLARTQLAALDNNHNVGRVAAQTKAGIERFKVDWSKRKKSWFVKGLTAVKSYKYLDDMMEDVLSLKVAESGVAFRNRPAFPPHSNTLPDSIALELKPDRLQALQLHRTRMRVFEACGSEHKNRDEEAPTTVHL